MPFSQTTASTIDDVISQMCQYAVDHAGFTKESNTTIPLVGKTMYRISKNGIIWNFRSDVTLAGNGNLNRIKGWMTNVMIGTLDPTALQGQGTATAASFWNFPGPFTNLYLFSEGTCVHVVIEITTGVFTHMSFGNITKTDTFVGGEYLDGNYTEYRPSPDPQGNYPFYFDSGYAAPIFSGDTNIGPAEASNRGSASYRGYMRNIQDNPITLGGEHNNYPGFGYSPNVQQQAGASGHDGLTARIFRDMPNLATLRSPILPMYVTLRDPISRLKFLAGYIPNVRLCPMNYLDPGEIILTDWIVFPSIAKESTKINYPETGNIGFAYRRVP